MSSSAVVSSVQISCWSSPEGEKTVTAGGWAEPPLATLDTLRTAFTTPGTPSAWSRLETKMQLSCASSGAPCLSSSRWVPSPQPYMKLPPGYLTSTDEPTLPHAVGAPSTLTDSPVGSFDETSVLCSR